MIVREIKHDDLVLARHVPAEVAWREDLNFFSTDEEFVQVGTWGYDNDKELLAHTHNQVVRKVFWTQEVLYIRKGSIKARIYDLNEELVSEVIAKDGDILILLRGGHGYNILEDGTQVLEVKNGPYLGAERDRRRL
ncbi:hypothetical protein [Hahella ganghwensis]|uniref:hypothetical protein n=1 Tax=Hahella ganghwensis TaxID=286420 RepID=UPI00036B2F78|nr:hypothetical protein [Hahella ganghwensis]